MIAKIFIPISFVLTCITGCASFNARTSPCYNDMNCNPRGDVHVQVYPGVESDISELVEGDCHMKKSHTSRTTSLILSIIDLPFSFMLDTVLLPFDLIIREKNYTPTKTKEKYRHDMLNDRIDELTRKEKTQKKD